MDRRRREALGLVARARTPDALAAALEVLPDDDESRDAILRRYRALAGDAQRQDLGGALRAVLVAGLRTRGRAADVPLVEAAARTYEFGFGPQDKAANLRAAALLTLDALDPTLAGYHAARLLTDEHTASGTREPALTAVRLLAAREETLLLYRHLAGGPAAGEEAAECFRALAGAPAAVLLDLAGPWLGGEDEVALLGLFDTLLGQPEPEPYVVPLMEFVKQSPLIDVVSYLVAAIVASRRQPLLKALRELGELPEGRAAIVRKALDPE